MADENVKTYRITLSGPQVPGFNDKPTVTFTVNADKVEYNRLRNKHSFFLGGKIQAVLSVTMLD